MAVLTDGCGYRCGYCIELCWEAMCNRGIEHEVYMHRSASKAAATRASPACAQRAAAPEGGELELAAALAALLDTKTAGSAAGLGAKQAGYARCFCCTRALMAVTTRSGLLPQGWLSLQRGV